MINIIGNIHDTSGYSVHTRNLAEALSKYTDVRMTTQIPQGQELSISDKILEMIKNKPDKDEINLIITTPLFWKFNATSKRNWAYLVWEGDRIPKCFVEEYNSKDIEYIFVPSNHTKLAIKKSGLSTDKVKVIPHGVNLDLFYKKKEEKEHFTFLANKGFRNTQDRGGIQYLIKAYIEEFSMKDNVNLLVKINASYGVPNLHDMIRKITEKREDIPRTSFITQNMKYEEMVKIYNRADVFVSPTRAEAYNIPCIEAMACGLPVLTTNFGGQTDFCNDKNGWIIGGELEEVKHEVQYEGIKWLTPDVSELRKKLRYIYDNPSEVQNKSSEALKTAKDNTWDKTAEKIVKLI